jgi:cholesterol oxidase
MNAPAAPARLWLFPWLGPRREGPKAFTVMPDPAHGTAKAICVPVIRAQEPGEAMYRVALDPASQVPLADVPFDTWAVVAPQAANSTAGVAGHLCLLAYDQSQDRSQGEWANIAPESVPTVSVDEINDALRQLGRKYGDRLEQELLDVAGEPSPPSAAQAPKVCFAFGSCQYPAGLLDRPMAEASYTRLANMLKDGSAPKPEFLLLLGDQIYSDASAGLLDPTNADDRYRRPTEELFRLRPVRQVMRRIPIYAMLDDHELSDNWEPYFQGAAGKQLMQGMDVYWTYQRGRLGPTNMWFERWGPGWALFVADSRSQREPRRGPMNKALLLGAEQTLRLEEWLDRQPADSLKFVATSSMLLPRHVQHGDPLRLDGWDGYPASLHRMLAFVHSRKIQNLVFLSGDEHLGCSATIKVFDANDRHDPGVEFRSVHAPALYAPFPFANCLPESLLLQDEFAFTEPDGRRLRCEVRAEISEPRRDGFCLVQADRVTGAWKVDCRVG